jgi:hypothetical protein
VRREWIERKRAKTRAAANPTEAGEDGAWYGKDIRA